MLHECVHSVFMHIAESTNGTLTRRSDWHSPTTDSCQLSGNRRQQLLLR